MIVTKLRMDVNKHTIIKSVGNISAATMICRVFGFIRDALVAYLFGATVISDAFYAAYRIANLFRRLFGEGAFASAFIPVFTHHKHHNRSSAHDFARTMIGNLLVVVLFLTMLGILTAPLLVRILASGFSDNPDQMRLTVLLAQIMFPYFVFISLAACLMGVLQVHKRFFVPALAPIMLSISIIAYCTGVIPLCGSQWNLATKVVGLSVSVLIGGLGQFAFMIPSYLREGFSLLPRLDFHHPGPRRVFKLMMPAMYGISIDQINMFISATFLASFLTDGSVTALYYADRLTQLPLALFGIASATVALPLMSQAVAQQRVEDLKNTLEFSLRMIGFAVIPSIVGLIVIGHPIIELLFERGAFDQRASLLTYRALVPFSIAVMFFSIVKLLANAFYAMQNMVKPVVIATCSMCVNIGAAIVLMRSYGVAGIASATCISSMVNALLLYYYIRRSIGSLFGKDLLRSYIKILCASVIMGAGVFLLMDKLSSFMLVIRVVLSICGGVGLYMIAAQVINIEERKHIMSLFRRKPS
ncbi:MAG: murein biosynthesis integral membrane protein MurJ [Elusimicrobia bacterium]|nr:murein biosynthesis integral membrane protein MurJ [Elusimicrobiota bacterium]MBD3412583.1 murein biosynthesis integral membrane protein MurJ [Elusimicrobiota bacterium]